MLGPSLGQSGTGIHDNRSHRRSPEEISQSLRLTRSPTYQWLLLQEQQRTLETIAPTIKLLAEAEEQQAKVEEEFLRTERELRSLWDKRRADAEQRRRAAQRELQQAEESLVKSHKALRAAQERVRQIRARQMTRQDQEIIERAIREKCAPFQEKLAEWGGKIKSLKNDIQLLEARKVELQTQLGKIQQDAEYWDKGKRPPEVEQAVEKAAENARSAHKQEVNEYDKKIAALEGKLVRIRGEKANLTSEITQLQAEVEQDRGKSGFWHWLARLRYDPQAELERAQSRYAKIRNEESTLVRSLEEAQSARAKLIGEEQQRVESACREEEERHYRAFLEARKQVPEELRECEAALQSAFDNLRGAETEQRKCEQERDRAREQAIEDAWQKLLAEAEDALDAAQKEYDAAHQCKVGAERNLAEAESSLERLKEQEHKALESGLAEPHRRVREGRARCERLRHEIALQLQECGVTLPESARAEEIAQLCANRREEVSRLLTQWDGDSWAKSGGVERRVVSRPSATSSEGCPVAEGTLYLDFNTNAEDNLDREGNKRDGLNTQLKELLERYGKTDTELLQEPLSWFLPAFFPDGLVRSYFVCNISYREDQPYLLVRPVTITPRMEEILPPGVTLGVCGRLFDNRNDPDNPVLLVQRIVDLSHCPRRVFEREIRVVSRTNEVYPGRQRRQNVLTTSFVQDLPPISVVTRER
ncbi:MAG: hypothetical protein H5U08_00525, partial [Thermogutta sp.]|uniref:hypothetical protein n=1 Tax=Thermogutta sp. TaxID=1962930 RepID=UPI0019A8C730